MRNLPLTLLGALLLVLLAPAARGEEPSAPTRPGALPDNMLVETLDNGLDVVIEERRATPIVHVLAYMRVGALYEDEYLGSGLSHYMEHIVSGGSTRRKGKDAEGREVWAGRTEQENKKLVKSIGGYTNAATYYNFTKYYITTRPEMMGTATDLIADYLQNCQFDPIEVAREQRVVQQELLRNQDNAGRAHRLLFSETMFKVHPVRVPVIGYIDSIDRITREDMLRFYDKHYTPQNCVVSVVGDVDKHEALALVERHFGSWKRKPLAPYTIPQEPEQTSPRWIEREHGSTRSCQVALGVPTVALLHPDLYKLDMLSNILGLSRSARLPRKFEHDPTREAAATGLRSGNWTPVFGAGRFQVSFAADTLAQGRTLVAEIWAEMGQLKEELVSQEEIDRAMKALEKRYYEGRAAVDDRADELASSLAWVHDPLFGDRYLEGMRRVTPEEVREAARRYLIDHKLNVVITTPPRKGGEREDGPEGEAAGAVRKVVLDNGLTLLLKRVPDYGMVDLVAAFNGGVIYEDEKTNGLFFLAAHAFWRGTKTRPFPLMNKEMDGLGMSLGSESHNNVWYVKAQALTSELAPSLDVFADVLLNPAIDPVWVDRVKGMLLAQVLPNLEVDAEEMVQRALRTTLYRTGPYRRQRFGTPQSVAGFSAEQVRALYETFIRPNNCVLAVYGDMDLDETEATLRRLFASWKTGEIPSSFAKADAGLEAPKTVDLTNSQVRTNYRIAWKAPSRQEAKKRAAMSVMNTIIGASGWLHARLREGESDYVYSVYGAHYAGDRAGHYFVDTDISPQDEAAVLAIIQGVVEDVQAGKFTDEELALAKQMLQCNEALRQKVIADVASNQSLSELYGEGYDYTAKQAERIRNVSREDVIAAAREVFGGPALRILVRPKSE